jgi:transposase
MDILELVRLLRAGESDRQIARLLGHNRRTIIRYRQWATAQGLLEGELPTPAKLQRLLDATLPSPHPPQQTSSVAPYAVEITAMRARGMEIVAIRARLEERH